MQSVTTFLNFVNRGRQCDSRRTSAQLIGAFRAQGINETSNGFLTSVAINPLP
jgi:hypothetical protein